MWMETTKAAVTMILRGSTVFFEYSNTPVERVVGYWKEAVLKQMARLEDDGVLLAKWTSLLA